ncbi:hypothetical protein MKK67_16505 [Methylobacterium sp. J-072]|uniref:hypothetical protein n=1 Tax=Methylobacterium sp. J-072 TaxID=2836651 RepID=UPI001FB9B9D2|nr:hypothetical protein [Methylobacterium sp. J-072]MCJ2094080.1 hypothetical protein [Methylobacterium sp. J-072]
MTEDTGPEAMLDACIAAYEAVKRHGTSEMQLAARVLLQLVGEQIAREITPPTADASDENVA